MAGCVINSQLGSSLGLKLADFAPHQQDRRSGRTSTRREGGRGPLDSDYFCALGTALWKLDKLKQALIAFEAALELDPRGNIYWVAASEIALLIGDAQKHRRYVRRAQHFGAEAGTSDSWNCSVRLVN